MIQSGNSRVKVTLYGQVNRAVRFSRLPADKSEFTAWITANPIRASESRPSAQVNKNRT